MRKLFFIALVVTLILPNLGYSEGCYIDPYTGIETCPSNSNNIYYTILHTEPDWCQFAEGSGLYITYNENIPYAPITAWYVVYPGDTTTSPPNGFDEHRFYIYNNQYAGCGWTLW